MNAYFIVDDMMYSRNREGFGVMYGDPYTAIGTLREEFTTLREAKNYVERVKAEGEVYYRVFLARRHGMHKVKPIREMIVFENGIDIRSRSPKFPEVAKFHMGNGTYEYCVIGTDYGHIHTVGGDVRTWKTKRGAQHAVSRYCTARA